MRASTPRFREPSNQAHHVTFQHHWRSRPPTSLKVGTPENGFVLRWRNHERSREQFGYPETVRQLERTLERSHSSARESLLAELASAPRDEGDTVFDWLREIIDGHPTGFPPRGAVELELA